MEYIRFGVFVVCDGLWIVAALVFIKACKDISAAVGKIKPDDDGEAWKRADEDEH